MAKGWLDNYNDSEASAPEGMEGVGFSNVGRNYSPAWGGQFQMGGYVYPVNYVPQAQEGKQLTFLQPTSDKLPEGYRIPYSDPSTERAGTIGGENGEPAYLVPSFKYGHPIYDPVGEFRKTGEHLGGPFKTWQDADKWENETRHPAVEKGENIMFPQEKFAMGGSIPGAVGFSYARTQGAAPSNFRGHKTKPSAQNGIVAESTFVKKPKIGTTVNESINKKGSEAKRFLNQWMDSPMYTEMAKHSDPDNYQNLTNWRKHNLQTANIHYNPNQLITDVAGRSHSYSGDVTIFPEGKNLNDVQLHELSHSSDRPQVEINRHKRAIPQKDADLMEKYKKSNAPDINDEWINYVTEPSETRARLNSIRQQAKKQGIYDPFKEKITPDQYKKLLETNSSEDDFNPLYQLKDAYRDTQIINLLNSVSQNEQSQKETPIAQNGKEMQYYQNGLDWQPKTISQNGTTGEETTHPDLMGTQNFVSQLIANTKSKKDKVKLKETHTVINDNIANAHAQQVKADEAFTRNLEHQRKVAREQAVMQAQEQAKFNALPKDQQESILYDQYNQQHGSISEYTPDSKLSKFAQSAVTPFTALTDLYQTGEVRDNLLQSVVNNPKSANAYDAAYLGALGYAAAPLVPATVNAVTPYATMIGNSLAADAVIGGNTIAGLNLGNAIGAGFATHGAMNIAPDAAKWLDRPSWENAEAVGWDTLDMLPAAGPTAKTLGEGFGYVGDKVRPALEKVKDAANWTSDYLGYNASNYAKNVRGLITGEVSKAQSEIDRLLDIDQNIYNSKEYLENQARQYELTGSEYNMIDKLDRHKLPQYLPKKSELTKQINLKQGRIDTANALKLTDEGLVQSGKDTSLGLRTGSTDIVDLETGASHPISTSVPNEDITFKLEGDKVVKSSNTATLPQVTPEYNSTVKKNIDFIEKQIPGAKVFGSAKNVAEAEVPHIIGDYDVLMSQSEYDKFAKSNPAVGTNGFAKTHNIPGSAKGIEPIDVNVIEETSGKATGQRAKELFRQVAPDDFYKAAKEAIKNRSEIKIPYSSQELVDMTNPSSKSIVDAYESTKPKHLNKIDALINYGKPDVVAQGQQQYVKSLVGSKGTVGPQFPTEQLSDPIINKDILDRINFIGNKALVAADPERMQLALNDHYINNSILVRQVDKGPIDKIEAAIKEYKPEAGGGSVMGIGQNHVTLGFPQHGWDNVTSVKQMGLDLDTRTPLTFLDDLEHQTSGSKLFTEDERQILSEIVDKLKVDAFKREGIDLRKGVGQSKDFIKESTTSGELIDRLPYSQEGKEALYEFAKKTNRQMAKKSSTYGTSNYTSTLRDFDEGIDVMKYSALDQVEMNKVLKSFSERKKASESFSSKQIDELLPKQYKGLKGYLEGGIDRATERLAKLQEEKSRLTADIKDLAKKVHYKKYKEEIDRIKEYQQNIEKQVNEMNTMRRDLRQRQVELVDFREDFKRHLLLAAGVGSLAGLSKLYQYQMSDEYKASRTKEWEEFVKENAEKEKKLQKMSPEDRKKAEYEDKPFLDKTYDWFMGAKNENDIAPTPTPFNKPVYGSPRKTGGIVDSDRGQWDYPGKITRIKGGNITMKPDPKTGKPLTQPILGIANTGERKMMYPGQDYQFAEGTEYVTEIPKGKLAQNGMRQEQKSLQNLDNLTNFTNYNKPQPGGWLNKYKS